MGNPSCSSWLNSWFDCMQNRFWWNVVCANSNWKLKCIIKLNHNICLWYDWNDQCLTRFNGFNSLRRFFNPLNLGLVFEYYIISNEFLSMTNIYLKLYSKILKYILEAGMEQSGFSAVQSCIDNIFEFKILKRCNKKFHGLFADLTKPWQCTCEETNEILDKPYHDNSCKTSLCQE